MELTPNETNDDDLAALKWLEAWAEYEYQSSHKEVELYQMDVDNPSGDQMSWDEEREYRGLIEIILAEPDGYENTYKRHDENRRWPVRSENQDWWIMEESCMVDDHFEIEGEERFLTATADKHTLRNGWYEEEEVEAFLATFWNELELDEELNDEEPVTNHISGDETLDPYDDERYVGEPYEKE
ncbi:6580_t:CDS:2, partial [Cetraspora pellucida]